MSSLNPSMNRGALAPTGSLFRHNFLVDTPVSRAFLFFAIIFVVSPASLYLRRVPSLAVVLVFISASLFLLMIPNLSVRRVPTPIDLPCAILVGYMSINCLVAIISGNGMNNALADLVSPIEIYLCFQIAKRTEFPKEVVNGWIKWILIFSSARGICQIFTVLLGIHVLAPIYDASALNPTATIGGFTYERSFDPVSGIIFAVALMLYITKAVKKWSLITVAISATILILGMTRSEWLACVCAVCVAMWYAGRLRKAIIAFIIIGLIVAAVFVIFPVLYESVTDRLITHTLDQISDPSDKAVGALRILEVNSAMEKFQTRPIFGHGLGSWFGTEVSMNGRDLVFVQLHNSYLNLLTNAGLMGVGLLLIIMLKLRRFLISSLQCKDVMARALFCTAAASLVWYGIFMAFEPIYAAYHLPVLIGTLWGMAAAMRQKIGSAAS